MRGTGKKNEKKKKQQQLAIAMFVMQAKQTICVIRSHYISENFLIL